LLIKIRIKRHKCLHPFSSLLIADYMLLDLDLFVSPGHLPLCSSRTCRGRHDNNNNNNNNNNIPNTVVYPRSKIASANSKTRLITLLGWCTSRYIARRLAPVRICRRDSSGDYKRVVKSNRDFWFCSLRRECDVSGIFSVSGCDDGDAFR